jgi:GNAT superfamily N-acetyltransferase
LLLTFSAATADRWSDIEELFGPRGACGGCWCMLWRLPRAVYDHGKGEGNREALKSLVLAGDEPGLLAYSDGKAVGWCALAPRDDYPALERSRVLKPVDEQAVWSISCLFIRRGYRRKGVSVRLLSASVEHAAERGARIVEGYPVEPRQVTMPDTFAWTGIASSFLAAGFCEVARRSETRPIMRYVVKSGLTNE